MASKNKKNKLKNSKQVPSALKHKGTGIKRLSFYTSSNRMFINNQIKNNIMLKSNLDAASHIDSLHLEIIEYNLDAEKTLRAIRVGDTLEVNQKQGLLYTVAYDEKRGVFYVCIGDNNEVHQDRDIESLLLFLLL